MVQLRVLEASQWRAAWGILVDAGAALAAQGLSTAWQPPVPWSRYQQQARDYKTVHGIFVADVLQGSLCLDAQAWSGLAEQFSVDHDCYLSRMAIRPAVQGQGLGRQALAAVEGQLGSKGKQRIWLDTYTEWYWARDFYLRNGYDDCGNCEWKDAHGQDWDLRIFRKKLDC